MTDYAALKAEDANPAYIGMPDDQRSAAINAIVIPGIQSVSPADARNALMFTAANDWGWLVGVANGWITSANASGAGAVAVVITPAGTGGQTRRIAYSIWDLFKGETDVPMTSARATLVQSALNILVTANVITPAGRSAVLSLGIKSTPWPVFYDFPQGVNPGELVAARLFNG